MTRLPGADGMTDAVAYDFAAGVRDELPATSRRSGAARVARVLDEYAGGRNEALRNFRLALDEPDRAGEPEPSPENVPYLKVQEAVFKALSGPYARRSQRIRRSLGPDAGSRTRGRGTPHRNRRSTL